MSSRGNALFLILIAVALFAALSYAVTQSGRGGGSVDKEKSLIAASEMVQYGSALRTAVQRMVLTGTAVTDIEFCSIPASNLCYYPWNFKVASPCTSGATCLFAPEGGGAVLQGPPDTAVSGGVYTFTDSTSGLGIEGVGTATLELMMYVAGISQDVCDDVNDGMGLTTIQDADTVALPTFTIDDSNDGEPVQCVQDMTSAYTLLYTLYER